jgi:hypothetical protein
MTDGPPRATRVRAALDYDSVPAQLIVLALDVDLGLALEAATSLSGRDWHGPQPILIDAP